LQKDEAILLAHHEADQAETLLLRLFRGAGPLGLSGMSVKTTLGNNELLRPLLSCSKENILDYGKANHLHWIEDESNQNPRFDRNYLRLEILPLLMTRWPRAVKSMARSASLCLEAANVMRDLATEDLNKIKENESLSLSVKQLLNLESSRRRSVIRLWLQDQGFLLPSKDHMDRIDKEVLMAQSGAKPSLKISDYLIKRIKGELVVETVS
jgi:tRNA(Ile)-lysidine synthase